MKNKKATREEQPNKSQANINKPPTKLEVKSGMFPPQVSRIIPKEFIDDTLARTDIVDLINRQVPLKRAGKNYIACCPFHKEKTPSFSVSPDKQFYYCFGCGQSGDAIGFLMGYNRLPFVEAVERLASHLGMDVKCHRDYEKLKPKVSAVKPKLDLPNEAARKALERAYRESCPIVDVRRDAPPVARYFANRGLFGAISKPPADLRFHPGMDYWEDKTKVGTFPTMLAIIRDIDGKPVSLHRTFLTEQGQKAPISSPKKVMCSLVRGCTKGAAIRLYKESERLGLCEGVETGISVNLATGIPVWPCVSAGGLLSVEIPDSVDEVLIFADRDKSLCGQNVANRLATRLLEDEKKVKILIPPLMIPDDQKSIDWLDVYLIEGGQSV